MTEPCAFRWKTGDEPIDVCVQPKLPGSIADAIALQAFGNHTDRHVSADGSWISVRFAADYEVKDDDE